MSVRWICHCMVCLSCIAIPADAWLPLLRKLWLLKLWDSGPEAAKATCTYRTKLDCWRGFPSPATSVQRTWFKPLTAKILRAAARQPTDPARYTAGPILHACHWEVAHWICKASWSSVRNCEQPLHVTSNLYTVAEMLWLVTGTNRVGMQPFALVRPCSRISYMWIAGNDGKEQAKAANPRKCRKAARRRILYIVETKRHSAPRWTVNRVSFSCSGGVGKQLGEGHVLRPGGLIHSSSLPTPHPKSQ